jgi:hypothetical protein
MKKFLLIIGMMACMVSCGGNGNSGKADVGDSVSTDSLKNPSFNPEVEEDSAAKQMNLDSAGR